MPELRWILIGCGALLLLGIYVWGRRGTDRSASGPRAEPQYSSPEQPLAERFEIDDFQDDDPEALDEPVALRATRPEDFSITAIRPNVGDAGVVDEPEPYRPPNRDLLRRGRIEPTLDDIDREAHDPQAVHAAHELTVELSSDDAPEVAATHEPGESREAPTLGLSSTPQPKRIERRKIIALRLAAGTQRFAGAQLRQVLEAEALDYGKYDVFHRMQDGAIVFSVASMVEPGTFDLEKMAATPYPGVTLFAQLPGPVAGIEALNELVACGKRLLDKLGGTLQDERGVPLTVHRIEKLRQEVRDFENGPGREAARIVPAHAP